MEVVQTNMGLLQEMRVNSALKHRRIYLSDEVTRESIFEVVYFLDRLRDLDLKNGTKQSIEIITDSYGGIIYSGSLLLSKIEQLKDEGYHIITTTSGVAMSMGFIITISGSERKAYRHATFLIHQPSSGTWGTLKDIEDEVTETKRLWIDMKDTIKKYTKITDEQLEEIKEKKKDWILNAQQALDLGVIDSIL